MSQSRSSDSRSVEYITAKAAPHKRIANHLIHQLGGEIVSVVQPGNRREFDHVQPDDLLPCRNQLKGAQKIIPANAPWLWRAHRGHARRVEGIQIDADVYTRR